MINQPSYDAAKDRYAEMRASAWRTAHAQLPDVLVNRRGQGIRKGEIQLRGLGIKTMIELRKWHHSPARRVHWDWDRVIATYQAHPKRFELAIWYRGMTLSGAAIGKPTWSGSKLRLDFIEANPGRSALDGIITQLSVAAGISYAQAIGATQIRITKPVNQDIINHYTSLPGFQYNKNENYCYRDLV